MKEKSYKYLQIALKPFVNILMQKVRPLSNLYNNEELLERFMKKFYKPYKDILENLLLQDNEFYHLLIKAGRAKELLAYTISGELKLETAINCTTSETLGESLSVAGQEYVDFIIDNLKNRVIWLAKEYNDLNFDKQYELKDSEGNILV